MKLFTTRVAKSNVDYWKKLRRCISYLNQIIDVVRIIGVFNFIDFLTWVGASYAAHPNMFSQTGGVLPVGYVMLQLKYSKKKLNAIFLLRMKL